MVDFVHNPELGVIGDMLASSDFCDGRDGECVGTCY